MEVFNEVTMIELQMQRNEILAKCKKKVFLEAVLKVLDDVKKALNQSIETNECNKELIKKLKNKINEF